MSKLTSIEFDALVVGLPSSAATNAVPFSANGLRLSFDTTISLLGNLVVADERIWWNGMALRLPWFSTDRQPRLGHIAS